jgi:hypothetical protein
MIPATGPSENSSAEDIFERGNRARFKRTWMAVWSDKPIKHRATRRTSE